MRSSLAEHIVQRLSSKRVRQIEIRAPPAFDGKLDGAWERGYASYAACQGNVISVNYDSQFETYIFVAAVEGKMDCTAQS